jgi:hypothetical protein
LPSETERAIIIATIKGVLATKKAMGILREIS